MKSDQSIVYYEDELNDDFAGFKRETITIDENYKYLKNPIWLFFSLILYRFIMTPFVYIYMKLVHGFKIVNRKCVKLHKKEGYFMYANHTLVPADGFIPSLVTFPKRTMVIVNADNISLKGTKTFIEMVGAVPIPNKLNGMRNFKNIISYYVNKKKRCVMIYPEAHIWPYCTKIRNFKSTSFAYPIKENVPVYSFTVTYHKGKIRTKIKAYVDGPFYPDTSISPKEAQEKLRNQVYETMVERSKNNTYEKVRYVKKGELL